MAFLFFAEEKCDLVILEVGMGGDLDATNIIKNTVLAVLVPISMDHQAFLGNTLAEITQKKAGIIKPGCSVVTVGQRPETMEVIREVCREKGADLTETDLSSAKAVKEDFAGQTLEYAFDFMEGTFGSSQEMVVFITELNSSAPAVRFLQENECERYFEYNKNLLFDERRADILSRLDRLGAF